MYSVLYMKLRCIDVDFPFEHVLFFMCDYCIVSTSRQTLLFSATLPKVLVDFAKAGTIHYWFN